MMMSAPRRARLRLVLRPRPRLPPVMTAVLFVVGPTVSLAMDVLPSLSLLLSRLGLVELNDTARDRIRRFAKVTGRQLGNRDWREASSSAFSTVHDYNVEGIEACQQ